MNEQESNLMHRKSVSPIRMRAAAFATVVVMALAFAGDVIAQSDGQANDRINGSSDRIERLIEEMTLEEKLGQLTLQWGGEAADANPNIREKSRLAIRNEIKNGRIGAFIGAHGADYVNWMQRVAKEESRLGIPIIVGNDVIHGYHTIFPIPLAEACSWNPAIVEKAARVAATEARIAGTHWTLAPMVDIARDPRWGRIAEGAGEDPYLGGIMAAARVRGFQGKDLTAPDSVLACVKHFAAYGAAEAGRDYNPVDISEQTLRDIYLPPFKAAVDEGVGTLMTAFNEINGVPATADDFLLEQILRREWGFKGFVVSDWTSITEMVEHGYAESEAHAALLSIKAGVDMDMSALSFRDHFGDMVKTGRLSEKVVDRAVRRVLIQKERLGLFDDPFSDASKEERLLLCDEHRAAARDVARHSIVLLKNEDNLLPLRDDLTSIAVIGPLADNKPDPLGTWALTGKPKSVVPRLEDAVVTVLAGIRQRTGGAVTINYAKGCGIHEADSDELSKAIDAAQKSDVVILVVGEDRDMSGEGHCRTNLQIPPAQTALISTVYAVGKPTIVLLMNGRPLAINWISENVPALVEAWHLGTETGNAVADVLFGDFNPCGRLVTTFPRNVGQVPLYYNHKNTGRPPTSDDRFSSKYIDVHWSPLYPFGYGLSYTRFEYKNLRLSADTMPIDGRLTVKADISNAGARAGVEVVQLYVRDLVGSLTRPIRELKGFQRIAIKPGETETVTFELSANDLRFHNRKLEYVVEPGRFHVWIAPNSAEGLQGEFEVVVK